MPREQISLKALADMVAKGYVDGHARVGLDVYVKRINRSHGFELTIGALVACHYELHGTRRVLLNSWQIVP